MRRELAAAAIAFILLYSAGSVLESAPSQGDVRMFSLLPLPAVALAAWSFSHRLPRHAYFFRVFAWALVLAIGVALSGIGGGFTPFGWYVAITALGAAVAHRAISVRCEVAAPASSIPSDEVAAMAA
jgi:hypothetical protein